MPKRRDSFADGPESLGALLDALSEAGDEGGGVALGDILHAVGGHSFTPVVLAVAVLLVSPISGIPGVPTAAAAVLLAIAAQALARRDHLWLPGVLLRRTLSRERYLNGIRWLRRPCSWVDRHSHPRLRPLVRGPGGTVSWLCCGLIPVSWPLLELLPMFTSLGALAIALIAFGLLTGDGLYAALGYLLTGAVVALVVWIA